MGSIMNIKLNLGYFYDSSYTSATRIGHDGKKGQITSNYDAIPPKVWEEMALQILFDPPKFKNRVWGL